MPGTGAIRLKPMPISEVATKNTPRLCETDASAKPSASTRPPASRVQREPIHFIVSAGRWLDSPQDRPSSEKLKPAADCDQCSSATIVYNTRPSEVKVVPVTKKNASEAAAMINHLRCMSEISGHT